MKYIENLFDIFIGTFFLISWHRREKRDIICEVRE